MTTVAAADSHLITGHECSISNGELVVESVWVRTGRASEPPMRPLPDAAQVVRTGKKPARWLVRIPLEAVEGELPLPLPDKDGWHRIHIDQSLDFVPSASLGLVMQLGHHATPDIERHDRRFIDAMLGKPASHSVYYASSDNIARAGGFTGSVSARSALKHRAMWAAALVFVLTSAGMVIGYRRLSRSADIEHAEELIRARFSELEDS